MTTTVIPHDAHGANAGCAACQIEGRAAWGVRYTEVDPTGPHVAGDTGGDNQVSEAWGRRFYRELGDGEYAVIDVDFYVEDEHGQDHDAEPRLVITRQMHFTRCTDLSDPGSSEIYADVAYVTEPTFAPPTEALARQVCAEFDPAVLDWNGLPDGHRPCHVVTTEAGHGRTEVTCRTHRPMFPGIYSRGSREGHAMFACDKGEGWIFLVDTGEAGNPYPRLVSLTGLKAALTRAVQARANGQDYGTELRVWRYAGPGALVELAFGPVPHRAPVRSVPAEHLPLHISTEYEVTGPREDGEPGRVRYLETTITVNGDA